MGFADVSSILESDRALAGAPAVPAPRAAAEPAYQVIRRNGSVTAFDAIQDLGGADQGLPGGRGRRRRRLAPGA